MQISEVKKQKLKSALANFAELHPKYPAGSPKGGQFMPKGGGADADYAKSVNKDTGKSLEQIKASVKSVKNPVTEKEKTKLSDNPSDRITAKKNALAIGMIKSLKDNGAKLQSKTKISSVAKSDDRLIPKEMSIEDFNKNLDIWSSHIQKLSAKERSSIPTIDENDIVISGLTKFYAKPKAANNPNFKNSDHIAVVNSQGLMQSAICYTHSKKDGVRVSYLATAPWNLQKDHPNKQKGSGAKAIVEAVKKSKELGYGGKISLNALDSAIPFYEHLGFKANQSGDYILLPKAADKLLKKYGG